MVEESIGEREREKFVEGLNSKVKLTLYKCFGREVQFKKYLHGLSDAGTRLLFKFRSGTHGLNEELGRHKGCVREVSLAQVSCILFMLLHPHQWVRGRWPWGYGSV